MYYLVTEFIIYLIFLGMRLFFIVMSQFDTFIVSIYRRKHLIIKGIKNKSTILKYLLNIIRG